MTCSQDTSGQQKCVLFIRLISTIFWTINTLQFAVTHLTLRSLKACNRFTALLCNPKYACLSHAIIRADCPFALQIEEGFVSAGGACRDICDALDYHKVGWPSGIPRTSGYGTQHRCQGSRSPCSPGLTTTSQQRCTFHHFT